MEGDATEGPADLHLANGNGKDHGSGTSATTEDLLKGIAARVSRLDDEFENDRDARNEDRALLKQVAVDLKTYTENMKKLSEMWMKIYQEKFAVPDPMKA